jgi:DNA-binding CsgD family transcriptional regulator/PAS domain-containing protein
MHEDPYVSSAMERGLLVEGVAVNGDDLVSPEALHNTEFYRELWRPLDIERVCSGVVFDGTDARKLPTALSVYRSRREPRFQADDVDLMRRLLAHLSRALGVMFHLRDSEWRVAASLAALDRLAGGVVLLDARRRIQFANRAAQETLRRADTLLAGSAVSADGEGLALHPRLKAHDRAFRDALARALRPLAADDVEHFSEALILPDAGGRPACVVHAAPLVPTPSFATGGAPAAPVVFVYDHARAAAVAPQTLVDLFGMTPAEARAALQILQGGGVAEMAARAGISENTFKSQLKEAYLKSHTHRQADLLKLLLALASR